MDRQQFTATPVVDEGTAELYGQPVRVFPGWWIVSKGTITIDVLPEDRFLKYYETIDEQGLLLSGAHRSQIERKLGFNATETPEHLVSAIERLADLRIGHIQVDFTPSQFDILAHRAAKRGMSTADYVKLVVDRITSEIFLT